MNDEESSQSLRKAMEQEFDDMDFEIPEAQNRSKGLILLLEDDNHSE